MILMILSLFLLAMALIFVVVVAYHVYHPKKNVRLFKKRARTLIVIGSGGHTTEMMRIVSHLNPKKFTPRLYVMAANDLTSPAKIEEFENKINRNRNSKGEYITEGLPRSRVVGQSFFSSIFTTLNASIRSASILIQFEPDVILCNGPGTCFPICLIAFFIRCMHLRDCVTIFVESICRVTSLSLTGTLLLPIVDVFVVQWPELLQKYSHRRRITYFDWLK